MAIKAEIITDSANEHGQRLTTFVLEFPRIVLAEFNTHRMLTKNSASSRAIPFEKMLKRVKEDPFIPIAWMKEHKGMQGNQYFGGFKEKLLKFTWLRARDISVLAAKTLSKIGLTKQIVNRLLEPFLYHTVIVTGSEWENFFALRAHEAAEIHIQKLAHLMLEAYNNSTPKQLKAGEWHIPFGDKFDEKRVCEAIAEQKGLDPLFVTPFSKAYLPTLVKIATARCARISYMNFEGKDDYKADIKLYNQLLSSGHMSPFEHCAQAMSEYEFENNYIMTAGGGKKVKFEGWSGNFRGFTQHRKTIEGENKHDDRVNRHTQLTNVILLKD